MTQAVQDASPVAWAVYLCREKTVRIDEEEQQRETPREREKHRRRQPRAEKTRTNKESYIFNPLFERASSVEGCDVRPGASREQLSLSRIVSSENVLVSVCIHFSCQQVLNN